ncbi:MAG: 3-oxoacyl-[acyl-carrier-protein] reductase [Thermodesulfovibrionales bacterium]
MEGDLLLDKVAIVTGATRGIGRAIALALCREGADCAFTYASRKDLAESLSVEVEAMGRRVMSAQIDVRDYEGIRDFVDSVKGAFGRLDILINNAGITRDKSFFMMSKEEWADVIDADLTGVFNVTRCCIITFLKQKSGNIVNISSSSGLHPLPGQTNYAAAKAGIIGFTKALAKEVAPYNIRVNAIAPGFIDTDMTGKLNQDYRQRLMETIPTGRFGTPEEVARVALFLCSEDSRYITGQTIEIDGGLGLLG